MRDEAERRIGHLYPKVRLPKEQGGGEATVIAWLWARTVTCPNPACGARMPLVRSFALSTKKGKQAWVDPVVDPVAKTVRFEVRTGQGRPQEGTVNRRGARCLVCGSPVAFDHIRAEGKAGRMGAQLMAIVAEGNRGRIYLPPDEEHVRVAASARPTWRPEVVLPHNPRDFKTPNYGMTTFADLFTPRQLVALTTFSDLIPEARERVLRDAIAAGLSDDGVSLADGGTGAQAYADAVAVYLGLGVSRLANRSSTICFWDKQGEKVQQVFARQAIPMTWDYVESNPLCTATGNFLGQLGYLTEVLKSSALTSGSGLGLQLDAGLGVSGVCSSAVISTDPPYYDNIGYGDLSDFFYVWLRRSLKDIYPDLFSTLLVPKSQELVATPYRFGGDRRKAERFFEGGLRKAFENMKKAQAPEYPLTVYYAFKQAESEEADEDDKGAGHVLASTGWETMLEGLLTAGFLIDGTWPMRSELSNRILASGTNALASSIVLVCRPRPEDAPLGTRKEFVARLKRELPEALKKLQHGNIAPVDLAQAAIGPGMAVFSSYAKVLEPDGSPMTVRTALGLIIQVLDEVLHEQESEYDQDTRWAVAWFESFGTSPGEFGRAETLSKAKDTSVKGLEEAGILEAKGGKVRLLSREELPADWDPTRDKRLTVWEVTQYLIRVLDTQGEQGAAELLRRVGLGYGEIARDLAYRLYTICERKKWAQEALAYNSLVVAWPELVRLASRAPTAPSQESLL